MRVRPGRAQRFRWQEEILKTDGAREHDPWAASDTRQGSSTPNAATNWQITNRALSIIHGHAATGLPCLALPDMATYNIIKIAKEISRKK